MKSLASTESLGGAGRGGFPRLLAFLGGCGILFGVGAAWAGPTGGQVVSGSAGINYGDTTTTINQSSQKAAINWQSFSIGSSETVNFNQPSSSSVTLNRVIGNESSVIAGVLNANGSVFLVNSNGILISSGASINAGGLVASTLDIDNDDFMAGNYVFNGDSSAGSLINMGTITATDGGTVALLGNSVTNRGIITATKGTVALAAGDQISLNFNGNSLVSITVDEGTLDALVANKKAIYADGGTIIMTATAADELLSSQVNNSGIVQAQTIDDLTGSITLYAHGGTTTVAGTLDASAPNGGDGGSIETSGDTVSVSDSATVTTSAANGDSGTWTLDPDGFTIGSTSADGDISASALNAALNQGNVTISSTDGDGDDGNINVNADVTWSENTLTLNATNNIYVNAVMTATGSASFAANYGYVLDDSGNPTTTASGEGNADGTPYGIYMLQSASTSKWIGSIEFDSTGSVTLNDEEYTVLTTIDEVLALFGTDVTGNYVLGTDITARYCYSDGDYFTSTIDTLSGNINGFGHMLTWVKTYDTGLIGTIAEGATVSNLGTQYVHVYNSEDNAGVADLGSIGALVNNNYGSIINTFCYSGSIDNDNGNISVAGGLVGTNYGLIAQCYAKGTIYVSGIGGGLVGINEDGASIIDSSFLKGTVRNDSDDNTGITYVGGLVGVNAGEILRSYALLKLYFSDSYSTAGCFVGLNSGSIDQSYVGNYSGSTASTLAGFVYENSGSITNCYTSSLNSTYTWQEWDAGFVYTNSGTISNVYAVTNATNNDRTHYGFAYENTGDGEITNAYWYATVAEVDEGEDAIVMPTDAYATHLTEDTVVDLSSYTGFDTDIWASSSSGYPLLSNILLYITTTTTASKIPEYGEADSDIGNLELYYRGLQWDDGEDDFSVTALSGGYVNAGAYNDPTSVISVEDYANVKGIITVTPKVLTVTGLTASDKTYDGTTTADVSGTGVISGYLEGQSMTVTVDSAAFENDNAGTDKEVILSYTVSDVAEGTTASNYVLDSLTATIEQLELILTATAEDKTYDGSTDATVSSTTLSTIVDGDDVSASYTSAAYADADAGTDKTVTVSGATLSGDDSENYVLSSDTATTTADIDQLVIEITGNADTNTSGTVDADNLIVTNTVDGDEVNLSGSVTIGSTETGTQTITDTSDLSVDNDNYTVDGASGTVTISDANLVLSEVVSGEVDINSDSATSTTTITQTTDSAVINWVLFSIATGETVEFIQPSTTSVTLNRVVGNEQSLIEGTLTANGYIFIINSNGIIFSSGSSVNVAGLVASTLEIDDDDFTSGNYAFTATSDAGEVSAAGDITVADSSSLVLLGNGVAQSGTVTAVGGDVLLVSADEVTLSLNSDGSVADYEIGTLDGTTTVAGTFALTDASGAGGYLETAGTVVSIDDELNLSTGTDGTWSLSLPGITTGTDGNVSTAFITSNLAARNLALNAIGGDLELNEALDVSGSTTLTLTATENVNINADLLVSGDSAGLVLDYGGDYSLDTDNGVSITYTGTGSTLIINGNVYTLVSSMDELADKVDSEGTASGYYALAGDIDASSKTYTSAVIETLSGTLAGLGHTISNLTISGAYGSSYIALIGTAEEGSVIRDLFLVDADITGYEYVGTLVGYSNADISNVSATGVVTGTLNAAGYSPGGDIGGLIGYQAYGSVTDAHADVDVSAYAKGSNTSCYIGGLIGEAFGTDISDSSASGDVLGNICVGGLIGALRGNVTVQSTVSNCYATGNVTGEDPDSGIGDYDGDGIDDDGAQSEYVGGLFGSAGYATISDSFATGDVIGGAWVGGLIGKATQVTLSNCYATGDVSTNSPENPDSVLGYVGGLVGGAYYSTVVASYATGDVTGNTYTGGLIGYSTNTDISDSYTTGDVSNSTIYDYYVGGLVGYATETTITDSYTTGDVTGQDDVGGLVGYATGGTEISGSYAEGDVTGNYDVGGLVGFITGGTISDSYASGDVVANVYGGGLAGGTYNSTVTDSYATGDVSGNDELGGLVGNSRYSTFDNVSASGDVTATGEARLSQWDDSTGGLIGSSSNTTITNSESTGLVTHGDEVVDSLIGRDDGDNTITNSSHNHQEDSADDTSGEVVDGGTDDSSSEVVDADTESEITEEDTDDGDSEVAENDSDESESEVAEEGAEESGSEEVAEGDSEVGEGEVGEENTATYADTVMATKIGAELRARTVQTEAFMSSTAEILTTGGSRNSGIQKNLDDQISYASAAGEYGASIRQVSADGVTYDLEDGDLSDDEEGDDD